MQYRQLKLDEMPIAPRTLNEKQVLEHLRHGDRIEADHANAWIEHTGHRVPIHLFKRLRKAKKIKLAAAGSRNAPSIWECGPAFKPTS